IDRRNSKQSKFQYGPFFIVDDLQLALSGEFIQVCNDVRIETHGQCLRRQHIFPGWPFTAHFEVYPASLRRECAGWGLQFVVRLDVWHAVLEEEFDLLIAPHLPIQHTGAEQFATDICWD